MSDSTNNFEEQRKVIDDRLGLPRMPVDTKGRIIVIVVLALALITIWFMLDVAIVTFVLTFVFYHLQKYALMGLAKTPVKIPAPIVLLIIYIGVIILFVLFALQNTPLIMKQISDIAGTFSRFDFEQFMDEVDPNLGWLALQIDVSPYIDRAVNAILDGLTSFGSVALNFLISLLLSFLFILEKRKIIAIADTIRDSRVAFIYRYFLLFAGSFCYTFGKVMKVQVVIAAINCGISMIYLSLAGFPYIMVLAIMIFILGLIPVAGVFISLIPLTIIAFNVGGIGKVIEVLLMIALIHAVEAYFLNPKLMSHRTSLPVSIVFVVLIISQRYLGAWGMIIGVPIFIYILNVLNIDYRKAMVHAPQTESEQSDEKNAPGDAGLGPTGKAKKTRLRNPFSKKKEERPRNPSGKKKEERPQSPLKRKKRE